VVWRDAEDGRQFGWPHAMPVHQLEYLALQDRQRTQRG
jgi:hypothetical protein